MGAVKVVRADASETPIRIDTSQIPAVEVMLLSKATLDFVLPIAKYIMSNPEERRRYEEWLNERNGGKTIV